MPTIIQQMDVAILLWIQENLRSDIWTGFWKAVTHLGDTGWFWIVLGLVLFLFKKTRRTGIAVMIALMIGALITNLIIKNSVARIRPYDFTDQIILLIGKQWDYSFPSGHSCASFAAAYVCLKRLKPVYGSAAMILAVLIAFSRLYVGVHYPTDVIGGIIIGLFSGWAALRLVSKSKE